jgi:hypothetical protein
MITCITRLLVALSGLLALSLPSATAHASCATSTDPPLWSWPADGGVISTSDYLWIQPRSDQQLVSATLDGTTVTAEVVGEGYLRFDSASTGEHTLVLDFGDVDADESAEIFSVTFSVVDEPRAQDAQLPAPVLTDASTVEIPFTGDEPIQPCLLNGLATDCYDQGPLFAILPEFDRSAYSAWPAESLVWITKWTFDPSQDRRVCVPGPCPPYDVSVGGTCDAHSFFEFGDSVSARGCVTVQVRTPDGRLSPVSEPFCVGEPEPREDAGSPGADAGTAGNADPTDDETSEDGCAAVQAGGTLTPLFSALALMYALGRRRRTPKTQGHAMNTRTARTTVALLGLLALLLPTVTAHASCPVSADPPLWSWPVEGGTISTSDYVWVQPALGQTLVSATVDGTAVTTESVGEGFLRFAPVAVGAHDLVLDFGDTNGDSEPEVFTISFEVSDESRAQDTALPAPEITAAPTRDVPFDNAPGDLCLQTALATDCFDVGPRFTVVPAFDRTPYAAWPEDSLVWITEWTSTLADGTTCEPGACQPFNVLVGGTCDAQSIFRLDTAPPPFGCVTVQVRTPDGRLSPVSEPFCIGEPEPGDDVGTPDTDAGLPDESDATEADVSIPDTSPNTDTDLPVESDATEPDGSVPDDTDASFDADGGDTERVSSSDTGCAAVQGGGTLPPLFSALALMYAFGRRRRTVMLLSSKRGC